MNSQDRYIGEPLRLYDLMNDFTVRCPKCDGKADITIPRYFDYKNGSLKCRDCHFSEKAQDRIRYRISLKSKCHYCRERLKPDTKVRKNVPKYINIICESCNVLNKISENLEAYIFKYNESGAIDPAFGLPLWYQDTVKGNIIWSFNFSHLTEIRNYVAATLRERTTDRFNMTMVEKLPDFIKMAKNRMEVLKAIDRMLYTTRAFKK